MSLPAGTQEPESKQESRQDSEKNNQTDAINVDMLYKLVAANLANNGYRVIRGDVWAPIKEIIAGVTWLCSIETYVKSVAVESDNAALQFESVIAAVVSRLYDSGARK